MLRHSSSGFSLIELLAASSIAGLMMAAGVGMFGLHHRAYRSEDVHTELDDNVRIAAGIVSDAVRAAGDSVPDADLGTWITWFAFDGKPIATSTSPPGVTVARCFFSDVAQVATPATAGATTLDLSSTIPDAAIGDLLDTDNKSLIVIDGQEHAHVTAVSGGTITLDTDPLTADAQGLRRAYPVGTPICRIDVHTLFLGTDPQSGRSALRLDRNQGGDVETVADGITGLAMTTVLDGKAYRLTLTGEGRTSSPLSGETLSSTLTIDLTVRN